MQIFAENAPLYWAAGLPVIPLRVKHKAPAPVGWQVFCSQMPEKDTQEAWLRQYADGNVGLPLGPCSGLVAIDLDTDDERITALIERLIPPTPWVRRGKKGAVYLYKSPIGADHRTFRIKDINGASIVECLAKGTQIVLPPSIHPDTMMPYTATMPLWEALAKLPPLPRDIETSIRSALSDAGIELSTRGSAKMVEWVASGARDSSMVSIAGLLARAVLRSERTLAEAFGEIETWIANFTEKVAGDSLDPRKARQKIVEFIKRDIVEGKKTLPVGWNEGLSDEERDAAAKEFGEDSEEWTFARCVEYLDVQFELHDRKSPLRMKAVADVLRRIAGSTMSSLEKEQILSHINGCSGKAVTMTTLRRRLTELERGELEGTDHTQIARALLNELERFGEVRMEGDRYWQWRGSHWEVIKEATIMEIIASEFGSMSAARRYSDHKGVLKVAENLMKKGLKDSNLVGINFANGFLTADLVLHPHSPIYGCTYSLPYCYEPDKVGAPHRFFSFLHDCWGADDDYQDKVKALRQAIAVTMFQQAYHFQKAFCLFGVPESGKSVLKDILLGLMPEGAVCTVPPHKWDDKFLPAQMFGKLINYCGELSEHAMIDGAAFKAGVDGDEIAAQHKNRPIFHFKPTCAQWFNSNHIPRSRDSSAGFTRRWLFLCFTRAVNKSEKIVGLQYEILAEEREAIAVWAVQAMPEVVANHGYVEPASHVALVRQMGNANNSVREFITSSGQVVLVPGARTSEQALHEVYWSFAKYVARSQPVSLKVFRARMDELQNEFGFRRIFEPISGQGEAVCYEGIKIAAVEGRRLTHR